MLAVLPHPCTSWENEKAHMHTSLLSFTQQFFANKEELAPLTASSIFERAYWKKGKYL